MFDIRTIAEIATVCAFSAFALYRSVLSGQRSVILKRHRKIFNAVNDAIFVHDGKTGRIIDVNLRAQEMYGMTRDEILLRSISRPIVLLWRFSSFAI